MLPPRSLLAHADRLLSGSAPDEADVRRAVSALYYALFHLLTLAAAERLAGGHGAALQSRIRRSTDHRDVRRLCQVVTASPGAVPKLLEGLLAQPPSPRLRDVAEAFALLQDARHSADYDLDLPPTLTEAEAWRELAHEAFDTWDDIVAEPDTQVFLTAVLLADRWGRRG